jgi:hypothetical protein
MRAGGTVAISAALYSGVPVNGYHIAVFVGPGAPGLTQT